MATITALIGGALLVDQWSRPLLVAAIVVALVGGFSYAILLRRRGTDRLETIVRLYLHQVEQIHKDFSQRRQLDQQVTSLARYFHDDFGLNTVAVFARRKRGYMLTDLFGAERESLKNYRVLFRPELEHMLEKRESSIPFRKVYPGDGSQGNDPHPFDQAVPVLTSGRCNYFIAFSTPQDVPFRIIRPFLLSLADQVGNFKHLDDATYKHNLTVQKLRQQLDALKNDRSSHETANRRNPTVLISALDKLARIYDRNKLYAAYLRLLAEEFKVDSAVLLVHDAERRTVTRQGDRGKLPNLPADFTLAANHSLFELLSPERPVLSLEAYSQDGSEAIAQLKAAGIRCLGFLNGSNPRDGYIGMNCPPEKFSPENIEVFSTFSRMFGLILDNLTNFEKIERLSYTDEMTGLYNYRYFYKRLQQEMTRAQRFNRHLGLVIFDVDGFKVFNDTYGHQSGDFLLEQLGGLLTKSVRSIDIVSRYGGEEFCIVMPDTNAADCINFMDRLRNAILENEFRDKFTPASLKITVSLGGAIYPNDAQRIDRLIYCADMALLQAKSTGKNKSFMFDENLITVKK